MKIAESGPKKGVGFEVKGPLRSVNQWINMSNRTITLNDGSQIETCSPALGYSFAAGTTDGPGEFDFTQGARSWSTVIDFVSEPSMKQRECQEPKEILLDTGEVWYKDLYSDPNNLLIKVTLIFLDELVWSMASKNHRYTNIANW